MTSKSTRGDSAIAFSMPMLSRLSVTEAEAFSSIAKHGAAMTLALPWPKEALLASSPDGVETTGPDTAVWQLGFESGHSEALYAACDMRRDLEWAGARLRLHLPRYVVSAWVSASLPEAGLCSVPEALLAPAVETLLTQVCEAVDGAHTSARLLVCEEPVSGGPLRHSWTLTARNKQTGQIAHAVLEADALGLMLLANLIKRAPRMSNGMCDETLPVVVYADLGWTTLPASELKNLRPRDTVFIDHYRVMPEGDLWLVAGAQGLRVRPTADSYCVTQGWTSLMNEIPEFPEDDHEREESLDEDSPETEPASTFDVDAIPVRLTFCLGERQLTLGELRSLQPGETFDLARPLASGPVIVRANGAWLGTGDLVDIDGRIGVTLRTLGDPKA